MSAKPSLNDVSVVIPTRNEAKNLPYVLENLPDGLGEVILVDGNSVDDTVAVARELRPDIVVVHQSRRGKGNALAAGFAAATKTFIVMIDADGSMDPKEIHAFVAPLHRGVKYAKGSRFTSGGGSDDISRIRDLGNRFLNGTTNILFRTRFSDLCYGYNAFHRDCLAAFALPDPHDVSVAARWGDGFEIETLINVRVAKAKVSIAEVPSFESERIHGESNLRTFRDGTRVLATIMRERFSRTPVPVVPSAPVVVDLPDRSVAAVDRAEAV
ncbi:glycosyltransferase family 2 protein [Nakamurella sp.]|uniref:glycosyltransferase family 2 protein n=1 Tax=Nakamurella sp. TaxID=1869182 RepID=UPI003B3AC776